MIGRIELCPINVVETADELEANIPVSPEFCAGHRDIKDFSHLLILYWRRRFFVISA
jgi:tRNA (Thr-GGU) A37 N-methylase